VDDLAVVNASPLILLSRGACLDLLCEFARHILVPQAVAEEIAAKGIGDITARAIHDTPWIEVIQGPPVSEDIASWGLGKGESSVLAVAVERPGMVAIIDDLNGRKCAASLHIPVRGTLGIVLTAKHRGLIPKARPVLEQLIAAGLHLRRSVLDESLKRVGE
jgi:predicted nucleic acid-binding protein